MVNVADTGSRAACHVHFQFIRGPVRDFELHLVVKVVHDVRPVAALVRRMAADIERGDTGNHEGEVVRTTAV